MAETTATDQSDPDRASDPAPAEEALADGRLLLRRDGPVARVVFNAPERHNAMSLAMWRALGDVAERLAGEGSVRVVALEGAGDRAFVSGADISEFSANRTDATSAARYADAVARAEDAIGALPCPTLALVRGYCIGGGLAIAIRCDLRIADDTARFAVTPGKLGLGYEYGGVAAIVDRVGPSLAADLLYTARQIPADEALSRGLANRVVPASAFASETDSLIARIAGNAPLTLRAVKAALIELARPEAQRNIARVDGLVAACFDSADYREGQAAFADKRRPVFRGE